MRASVLSMHTSHPSELLKPGKWHKISPLALKLNASVHVVLSWPECRWFT